MTRTGICLNTSQNGTLEKKVISELETGQIVVLIDNYSDTLTLLKKELFDRLDGTKKNFNPTKALDHFFSERQI